MRIKEALEPSSVLNDDIYTELFQQYFPLSIQKLAPKALLKEHRLKKEIIITELTNYFVGIFGCATHDAITFSNQIPVPVAVHQLVILEHVFDVQNHRSRHLEAWQTSQNSTHLFDLNRDLLHAN